MKIPRWMRQTVVSLGILPAAFLGMPLSANGSITFVITCNGGPIHVQAGGSTSTSICPQSVLHDFYGTSQTVTYNTDPNNPGTVAYGACGYFCGSWHHEMFANAGDGATYVANFDAIACTNSGSSSAAPVVLDCCSPTMNWTNTSQQWLGVGVVAHDNTGATCWEWGGIQGVGSGYNSLKVAPGGSVQFPAGTFCETNCCPVGDWSLQFTDADLGYFITNLNMGPGTISTNGAPVTNPPIGVGPTPPGGGTGGGAGTNAPGQTLGTNAATIGSVIGVQLAVLGLGQELGGLLSATNLGAGMSTGLTGFFPGGFGSNALNALAKSNVWVLNQTNLELWASNQLWGITSRPSFLAWATNQALAWGTNAAGRSNAVGFYTAIAGDSNLVSVISNATYWGNQVGNGITNFEYSNELASAGASFGALVGSDTSGAGDYDSGLFGVIHWDNVFNGSVIDNPSLGWTPKSGSGRGPDLTAITGVKNILSLLISWGLILGCLVWYGDAVKDALLEAMSGPGIQVGSTAVGVGGQVPGITLGLRALLTLAVVSLLVFLPTVLTGLMGSIAYALGWGGAGDVVAAVHAGAAAKNPFAVSWPTSITRIWGVMATWLPIGLMIVAGVNLVAARFTFMWRIPLYVFVSRLLWSI